MPRTLKAAKKGTFGKQVVTYITVKGRQVDAIVEGVTSATVRDLRVPRNNGSSQHLTGINKRTALTDTNVWF